MSHSNARLKGLQIGQVILGVMEATESRRLTRNQIDESDLLMRTTTTQVYAHVAIESLQRVYERTHPAARRQGNESEKTGVV